MMTNSLSQSPVQTSAQAAITEDKQVLFVNDKFPELQQPGRLLQQGTLTLQTRLAQRFFKGYPGKTKGLTQFSWYLRKIWQAAAEDDPYADLFLLRIYDLIVNARRAFQQQIAQYRQLLNSIEGIQLAIVSTHKPLELSLRFGTCYGYFASILLAEFDQLTRYILSIKYAGLMPPQEADVLLRQANKALRRVFMRPFNWKPLQLTREDVKQQTDAAQQAYKQMGKLPAPVLEGTLRARYAPAIKKSPPTVSIEKV
jgi:integrating conjugative element protein (TIGR03761 family)